MLEFHFRVVNNTCNAGTGAGGLTRELLGELTAYQESLGLWLGPVCSLHVRIWSSRQFKV